MLLLSFWICFSQAQAQTQPQEPSPQLFTLQGQLLEQGTRAPMTSANIFVLPHKLKTTTDSMGRFTIENVPTGPIQWVVNVTGYIKLEQGDQVNPDNAQQPRSLYLEKSSYHVFETTIYGRGEQRDDTTRSLKAKQAVETPGSFGDPIRAVQNLPGVARTNGSQVVIQGSSTNDTTYLIDDHEVPFIFHFGGFTSLLFPEATDRIDYLSAGFGAEHSRALGGSIGAFTKKPRSDRWGGLVFADVINAGVLAEGPLSADSSFLIGGRYSYIGQVVKAATEKMNNGPGALTVAPFFADLNLIYDSKLSSTDSLHISGVASQDSLEFLFSEPLQNNPSIRGKFENKAEFYRLTPQWTHKVDARRTLRFSLSQGMDSIKNETDTLYFRLKQNFIGVRGEIEQVSSDTWKQFYGFDNTYSRAQVDVKLPSPYSSGGVSNPVGTNDQTQASVQSQDANVGAYTRQVFQSGPWNFTPQLRLDWFKSTKEFLPAPRFSTRYDLDPFRFVRFATGLYYQPPEPQNVDRTYGNPDIKSPRNLHLAIGYEQDFRKGNSSGIRAGVGLFWKEMDRLVVTSRNFVQREGSLVAENVNNEGKGRAYGFELSSTFEDNPWTWVLAYTLSRSIRWNPIEGTVLSQFDQTHNLNLLGSYQSGNWKYASRFRYVTGNPVTPVTSAVYDADNDVYVPSRGALYSERFDPFVQLDVRVDRKFIQKTWIFSVYLDVQNLTNYRSPQAYFYSYDYSKREPAVGLGIIPSLGLKGEF